MSNIKVLRERIGKTQKELAAEVHVRQSTVAMWENGVNTPRSAILLQLAKALNCTLEELLDQDSAKGADLKIADDHELAEFIERKIIDEGFPPLGLSEK